MSSVLLQKKTSSGWVTIGKPGAREKVARNLHVAEEYRIVPAEQEILPRPVPVVKKERIYRDKNGFATQWVVCRECGWVGFYKYTPYGLGNPIRWTLCGHSLGYPDLNVDNISRAEALKLMKGKRHLRAVEKIRRNHGGQAQEESKKTSGG